MSSNALRHPHHEIILAYLNGAAIQFNDPDRQAAWADLPTLEQSLNDRAPLPAFHAYHAYRIKPEPLYAVELTRAEIRVLSFVLEFCSGSPMSPARDAINVAVKLANTRQLVDKSGLSVGADEDFNNFRDKARARWDEFIHPNYAKEEHQADDGSPAIMFRDNVEL